MNRVDRTAAAAIASADGFRILPTCQRSLSLHVPSGLTPDTRVLHSRLPSSAAADSGRLLGTPSLLPVFRR